MADYELLEERLISGRGVLRLPDNPGISRHSILYLDVIREPRNKYYNGNWNPVRSRYATLVFRRQGYVISASSMEYDSLAVDGIADISGQNLIALKCAYEGILISFVNLATAQGLVLTSYTDLIQNYESLDLGWDEVLIQCYADTALQARLFRLEYDFCDPEKNNQKKPPPPPPRLPKVPPGTAIGDISPPYDGEDDNGNTDPFDGDTTPPPPPPEPESCDRLLITVRVTFQNGTVVNVVGVNASGGQQYAPVLGASVQVDGSTTRALVQGGSLVGASTCDGTTNYSLIYAQTFNPSNPITNAEIVDIVINP